MAPRKQRVGILPPEDRMAIIQGARQLGLHPYELGALFSLESGPNMDPNIVGGAGDRHKGLIQFGQNEQRIYGISGPQTRAGQMPAVLRYFKDRGFKPGMPVGKAYATVLGGNPNVSLTQKDSFGTSVQGVLPRFKPGGDLYRNAQRVLGDIPPDTGMQAPPPPPLPGGTASTPATKGNILGSSILQKIMRENILPAMMKQGMQTDPYGSADALSLPSVKPVQDYLSDYISLLS